MQEKGDESGSVRGAIFTGCAIWFLGAFSGCIASSGNWFAAVQNMGPDYTAAGFFRGLLLALLATWYLLERKSKRS